MLLYIRQIWFDHRLSWNSTEFHRIKVREHFLDKIWIPDIRMRNMKDMKRFHDFGGINMNIHSNGRIYFSQL
jgi:cytidylate kinase